MHYHVETNALICLIKRLTETYSGGIQSTSVATRNSVNLLLESSFPSIDISLITIFIYYKHLFRTTVSSYLQPINQEKIYIYICIYIYTSSLVAGDLNFNS